MNRHSLSQAALDYQRIEQAIHFLQTNFRQAPNLQEVAKNVAMSEFHFQRLFKRWVGISPKRFLQYLTKEYAKQLLEQSHSLLDVTYEAGLSSPGRLHDLFVACDAVTPGDYKARGDGLTIAYGFHPSPFGECLVLTTSRGVCGLAFVHHDQQTTLDSFQRRWKRARFVADRDRTAGIARRIFAPLSANGGGSEPIRLHIMGTNFQIKVWEALLRIPMGAMVSYSDIATHLGDPKASRAVGSAVGQNPISFLIPCHRVLHKAGSISGYAWGRTRKRIMLGWEAAQVHVGVE